MPLLKQSLKAFIRASKGLFKVAGRETTFLLTRAHRGRQFLLERFGLKMHTPAVVAELCLEEGVNKTLHSMLLTLRAVKQGPHKGSIKSSSGPLPRVEPWISIILKAPSPLSSIIDKRVKSRIEGIEHHGEGGEGRDLKPVLFGLFCPHCGTSKNCAGIRLYAKNARGVTCKEFKKCTTSTRWKCPHGVPWTTCPTHREGGFRCGPLRLHKRSNGPLKPERRRLKAITRLQAKRCRLGSLGEPKRPHFTRLNSGQPTSRQSKKSIKRQQGMRPPPKREYGRGSLVSAISPNKQKITSSSNSVRVSTIVTLPPDQPKEHEGIKQPSTRPPLKRNGVPKSMSLAKRARTGQAVSTIRCKGNCPTVWTIDLYCPRCHG